ncbi:MAG TPA: ATP-binding protein [Candidatus Didemnitutus sp.]|nr:ATP-binding protein [Candidatus Didemnitutus sp.]
MDSIRNRLSRQLLWVLGLIVGLGLMAIAGLVWKTLVGSFDSTLRTRALALASLTEVEQGQIQFDFSEDFLRGFAVEHPRSYFEIWNAAGKVLARSPSLASADLGGPTGGTIDRPQFGNLALPNGRHARGVAFTFVPPGANAAGAKAGELQARLILAVDRGGLNETLAGTLLSIAAGGVVMAGLIWLLVRRALTFGLVPLHRFGEHARQITAESLHSRFPESDLPTELRPISHRLNDLLERLEASFARERQFSAGLAHELRTPLAELRMMAECALKWPERRDPKFEQDALAIALQMESLVTSLLTLTRVEDGQLALTMATVDIGEAARAAWEQFVHRSEERRLVLQCEIVSATVRADPTLLRSILSILFDNASAYAPEGGWIRIIGGKTGDGYGLRIANPAPDLHASDLPHIFDRLWRKDPARSEGEHHGLGLSLARAIASAMGWRLAAVLHEDGSIEFSLLEKGGPDAK